MSSMDRLVQGGRRPPLYSGGKNQTVTPTLCPSSSGTTAGCSGTTAGTPAVLLPASGTTAGTRAVLPLAAAVLPLGPWRGTTKRKSSQKVRPSTTARKAVLSSWSGTTADQGWYYRQNSGTTASSSGTTARASGTTASSSGNTARSSGTTSRDNGTTARRPFCKTR